VGRYVVLLYKGVRRNEGKGDVKQKTKKRAERENNQRAREIYTEPPRASGSVPRKEKKATGIKKAKRHTKSSDGARDDQEHKEVQKLTSHKNKSRQSPSN